MRRDQRLVSRLHRGPRAADAGLDARRSLLREFRAFSFRGYRPRFFHHVLFGLRTLEFGLVGINKLGERCGDEG